ncbi:hypothetical protein NP233_g9748 [Leucocoprinus birnbaumii]|uniref:Uncharacterized protein n=1 Tax=Leucocoprinus birnbaumii TaxID=56174 RepID=A0AAD5YLY5_9AGAR|nr:hypothetical protein NP233_g9748 [Leucocoprinus birnbaumii]
MASATHAHSRVADFLQQTNTIFCDARHLVSALPNVERFTVERSLRLLYAVKAVSTQLGDQLSSAEDITLLHKISDALILPLQHHTDTTEENPCPQAPTTPPNGVPGHPQAVIDVAHAMHLHNLGNSWEQIAEAMGVAQRTLYHHLHAAGIGSFRSKGCA